MRRVYILKTRIGIKMNSTICTNKKRREVSVSAMLCDTNEHKWQRTKDKHVSIINKANSSTERKMSEEK